MEVARQLVVVAAKKPFMRELCTTVLGDLVEGVSRHGNGEEEDVRLEMAREAGVNEGWAGCTPERLHLFLRLDGLLGGGVDWWAELARDRWQDTAGNVISSDRLKSLIPILEVGRE